MATESPAGPVLTKRLYTPRPPALFGGRFHSTCTPIHETEQTPCPQSRINAPSNARFKRGKGQDENRVANANNPADRVIAVDTGQPRFMTRPTARQVLDFLIVILFGIMVYWLRQYGE